MANILKLEVELKRCSNKTGNNSTCPELAQSVSYLHKRGVVPAPTSTDYIHQYRCIEHSWSSTAKRVVFGTFPYNQADIKAKVDAFLRTLIGQRIVSSAHTARELRVKYVKDHCGVMCYQEHSHQWKFVYYHQITEILGI